MMRRLRAWIARAARRLGVLPSVTPSPPVVTVTVQQPPASAADPLDTYARGAIGNQVTVDIFKGTWSSKLPAELGVVSGEAGLFDDERVHWMIRTLGGVAGWQVLELGPLEGGHSHMLQKAGAQQVLAIDACAMSYLKCLMVKDLCRLTRVDVRYGDFMTFLPSDTAAYDLIVASGVLYHQRDPIACIARMAARADKVFLWTHYYADDIDSAHLRSQSFVPTQAAAGSFQCELFRLDYDTYLPGIKYRGGVDDHVHWMRRDDILACLRHHGLSEIEIMFDQQTHAFGPNFALLAKRPPLAGPGRDDSAAYRAELLAKSGPEPWCIDALAIRDGYLEVSGWSIPPAGVIGRIGFAVDGQAVAQLERGLPREDVGAFYWFFPTARRSGFFFRHPLTAPAEAPLRLQYVDALTGQVIAPQHDFHIRPQDLNGSSPPVAPPLNLVLRTHTGNTLDQYFVEGYAIYRTITAAYLEATGQALGTVARLVDFGCGPGRLARHLAREPGLQVLAVDVDPECVAWCQAHLPDVAGLISPLRPPLSLAAGSVDCVLAMNVLLHLGEQDGLDWLAEWHRICRPGGTAIVTIAADLALTRARISEPHYESIKGYDFHVLSRNPDLDDVIADTDYYKNVLHSHDYVRRVWPTLGWEVLRIFPGSIGNHHDLVILRRGP